MQGFRLSIIFLLSMLLMWADENTQLLKTPRYYFAYVLQPVNQMALLPSVIGNWFELSAQSHDTLMQQNSELKTRNLVLDQRIQRLISLETENIELRELLGASERIDDSVLSTEIITVDEDPISQQIMINRGGSDKVFVGQPVLDAKGLMGQVVEVQPNRSRVLLIADSNHEIPVQVNRNGVRAIAVGTGQIDQLKLIYVPDTADIKQGDLLVSSGLGMRYPAGYPVAEVTEVKHFAGQAYARVSAKPSAALGQSRQFLLVFNQDAAHVPDKSLWQEKP